MKVSELQQYLEKVKEEFGDVEVTINTGVIEPFTKSNLFIAKEGLRIDI